MRALRSLTRRIPGDERGATTVLVAILVVVLFGFTALAVDVGRLYAERRQLQTTADVSALSGAQLLVQGVPDAAVEEGKRYIGENPTVHHPGDYSPDTGDGVQVKLNDTSCDPDGVIPYDCITSTVVAPPASDDPDGFQFFLAPILDDSLSETGVSATATAVVGAGAPGGKQLTPWMLLDCPIEELDGAAAAASPQTYNPSCPPQGYRFSTYWKEWEVNFLLNQSNQGNFQAGNLLDTGCPEFPDQGFGPMGGVPTYKAFLAGTRDACNIGPGARMRTQTGNMANHTQEPLVGRGVPSCTNQVEFDRTLVDGNGDGVMEILDHDSPCLIALALVVNTNPNEPWASNVRNDLYRGACCILELQHPDPMQRFRMLEKGGSRPYLVRRFGLFYITHASGSGNTFEVRGVFVKAVDSADSDLAGQRCMTSSGVCVVKLIG
jgi:hypothetical protein